MLSSVQSFPKWSLPWLCCLPLQVLVFGVCMFIDAVDTQKTLLLAEPSLLFALHDLRSVNTHVQWVYKCIKG